MDPISAVFASYLEISSNAFAERIADTLGTQVTDLSVRHNDIEIPYAYQRWRIIDTSVCESYRSEIDVYSNCTLAAKSLFKETCDHLRSKETIVGNQERLRNMYCTAASSYQPTIAGITWSEEVSELELARTECNAAIAEAIGSADSSIHARKKEVCDKYHAMQEKADN